MSDSGRSMGGNADEVTVTVLLAFAAFFVATWLALRIRERENARCGL